VTVEIVAIGVAALMLVFVALGIALALIRRAKKHDPMWADTDYDPEYTEDSLAFPGTSDTRTVREVDDYIKSKNAELIQQSNLGELP
jgi:hypothetical protein